MDYDHVDIELRDVDKQILEELSRARCTRRHLATLLEYDPDYIYKRVHRLAEHGYVDVIHDGFYRLSE